MKRFLLCFIVLLLFCSVAIADQYSPALGMTMTEFMYKYNSIESLVGSPLRPLQKPYKWSEFNGYNVAWFSPDSTRFVTLLLLTKDPQGKTTECGLDRVQVFMNSTADFLSFLTVADRCAQPFSFDFMTMNMSQFSIFTAMEHFYESRAEENNVSSYCALNTDPEVFCRFFKADSQYYIDICTDPNN